MIIISDVDVILNLKSQQKNKEICSVRRLYLYIYSNIRMSNLEWSG